ncbi:MAG: hypothetical protein ABGZ53_12150 [Fuerstiella sp.]
MAWGNGKSDSIIGNQTVRHSAAVFSNVVLRQNLKPFAMSLLAGLLETISLRGDDDFEIGAFDFPKFLVQDRNAWIGSHRDSPVNAVVGDEHAVFFQAFQDGPDGQWFT